MISFCSTHNGHSNQDTINNCRVNIKLSFLLSKQLPKCSYIYVKADVLISVKDKLFQRVPWKTSSVKSLFVAIYLDCFHGYSSYSKLEQVCCRIFLFGRTWNQVRGRPFASNSCWRSYKQFPRSMVGDRWTTPLPWRTRQNIGGFSQYLFQIFALSIHPSLCSGRE